MEGFIPVAGRRGTRASGGWGGGLSIQGHIILLICIGLILNFGNTSSLPVKDLEGPEIHVTPVEALEEWKGPADTTVGDGRSDFQNDKPSDGKSDRKRETDLTTDGDAPVLLIPEDIIALDNTSQLEPDDNHDFTNRSILVVLEYQPSLVIRCGAKGYPRPNVTWRLDGQDLPEYVTGLTYSTPDELQKTQPVINDLGNNKNDMEEAWVDLKLPLMNNAFYGRLRCTAENVLGSRHWEIELIHNANSSLFMRILRGTLASIFLGVGILFVKLVKYIQMKRKEKLYEKLPPQDLEIIRKFQTGLPPPLPSPSFSIATQVVTSGTIPGCVPGIEITIVGDEPSSGALALGYRPVKHELSSPDLQNRGGGASTPSSCRSVHVMDSINSWTNYVPYDDRLETSTQHFTVDFSAILENGQFGMMFAGKVRDDLTMKWSTVAAKTGRTERDDNFVLESILTELKILASLPKPHRHIVNLRGAYTKLLYKRQAFVFVDYCANGNLATFIDLNQRQFVDVSNNDNSTSTGAASSAQTSQKANGNVATLTAKFTANNDLHSNNGETVKVLLNKEQPTQYFFSMKDLLAWASHIADGMYFLHKNRIIHGNLSTANIYLSDAFVAKIGNIGYPPPESQECIDVTTKKWLTIPQFGYEHFSKKSDIWSYGCVLWEIFSLRRQQCPDKRTITNFLRRQGLDEDDDDGIEIPEYASPNMFELLLCCWNEDGTFCPEFDFFARAFRHLHKQVCHNESSPPTSSIRETTNNQMEQCKNDKTTTG